jgi:hypothetical protein
VNLNTHGKSKGPHFTKSALQPTKAFTFYPVILLDFIHDDDALLFFGIQEDSFT